MKCFIVLALLIKVAVLEILYGDNGSSQIENSGNRKHLVSLCSIGKHLLSSIQILTPPNNTTRGAYLCYTRLNQEWTGPRAIRSWLGNQLRVLSPWLGAFAGDGTSYLLFLFRVFFPAGAPVEGGNSCPGHESVLWSQTDLNPELASSCVWQHGLELWSYFSQPKFFTWKGRKSAVPSGQNYCGEGVV